MSTFRFTRLNSNRNKRQKLPIRFHNRNSKAFNARSDSANIHIQNRNCEPQDSYVATEIITLNFDGAIKPHEAEIEKRYCGRKIFHYGDRHYKRARAYFFLRSQSVAGKFQTGARIYHPPLAVRGFTRRALWLMTMYRFFSRGGKLSRFYCRQEIGVEQSLQKSWIWFLRVGLYFKCWNWFLDLWSYKRGYS